MAKTRNIAVVSISMRAFGPSGLTNPCGKVGSVERATHLLWRVRNLLSGMSITVLLHTNLYSVIMHHGVREMARHA